MNLQVSHPSMLRQVAPAESVAAAPPAVSRGPAPGATEQPFFRFDIVRALELHRKLALGFAFAGLALAIAYAVYAWPKYVAQSQIYIQPTSAKILDQGNNAQRWPYDSNSYDSFIQQQVQLASNPDVLVSALHKLPEGSWQRAGETEQQAAERLGGVLKVERLGSSYQVAITAQARSADMAANIANAVANSIVEKAAHEANAGDTERLTILEGERDRVQNQLNADLAEQDALNKQLGMAAVGTEAPDLIDNAIGTTRDELIKARTDHDEAEARFESLGAGTSSSTAALDAEADELIANDAGLTSMKTSLNSRRATLITQMANLMPDNPAYKLDADELSKINNSLDAMMQDLRAKAAARIQEKLKTDLERTSAVESQLNAQLRQLAATAASATPKLQRANDLATDIVRLHSRYSAVDEALHDIQLQDSVPGAVHLSVAAVPPLHPSLAGILRKSLPMALGGILLGLLAALLANQLDPRVYIGPDIENLLGFAPMIALPDCDEVSDAVFEEHILRLSTAIEHARKQGTLRTCIFTGSGTGTGVTTLVTRVRDMLSSMGRATVLVNATGTAQPAALTSAQKVDLPSNERGTRSTALLQRVTQSVRTQDESLVLTDTAPLLISAETEYLARFVDCAIVVVQSGATTRSELRATAEALQRLSVSAVGLVLNRVRLDKANAAFRKSVRDVEAHLRVQGRSNQNASSRPRHFAEEMPAAVVPVEAIRPAAGQQADLARAQATVTRPEPDVMAESAHAEHEQPVGQAEPAIQDKPFWHEPAARTQHADKPMTIKPDEQPKKEDADAEETILSYRAVRPQHAGQNKSHGQIEEQMQKQRTPVNGAKPEGARSEDAKAEYPVSLPESASSNQAARRTAEPAADQTVWPGPSAFSLHPPAAKKTPAARNPAAPALDPDSPWWLSETPITTSALDAEQPQRLADQLQRAPEPASGLASGRETGPAPDEPVRLPVSRLSGLRNVIFGTGSRSLRKRETERGFESRREVAFEPQADSPVEPLLNEIQPASEFRPSSENRPLHLAPPLMETPAPALADFQLLPRRVQPPDPVFEPLPAPANTPMPGAVRAQIPADDTMVAHEAPQGAANPEILPPQPIAAPRHRRDSWDSEPKRLDRGETIEEMPVLPSRRGQYRRKS